MHNPFRRKHKYTPPNPTPPEFSAGGLEMWKLLMDLRERVGVTEAMVKILAVLLLASVVQDFL